MLWASARPLAVPRADADAGEAAGSVGDDDGCEVGDGACCLLRSGFDDGRDELRGVRFAGQAGLGEDFELAVFEACQGDGAG